MQDHRAAVTAAFISLGWKPSDGTAVATKTYQTAVGIREAAIYLSSGDEYHQSIQPVYYSEGRNIAANLGELVPRGASPIDIERIARATALSIDKAVG